MDNKQTYGEILVGLQFNPSNDDTVSVLKKGYADIIDLLNDARKVANNHPEYQRYLSTAITQAQTAQMRAVKAVTAK